MLTCSVSTTNCELLSSKEGTGVIPALSCSEGICKLRTSSETALPHFQMIFFFLFFFQSPVNHGGRRQVTEQSLSQFLLNGQFKDTGSKKVQKWHRLCGAYKNVNSADLLACCKITITKLPVKQAWMNEGGLYFTVANHHILQPNETALWRGGKWREAGCPAMW